MPTLFGVSDLIYLKAYLVIFTQPDTKCTDVCIIRLTEVSHLDEGKIILTDQRPLVAVHKYDGYVGFYYYTQNGS